MNKEEIPQFIKTYGSAEIALNNKISFCYLIICNNCNQLHYKPWFEITKGLSRNKLFFCSRKCNAEWHSATLEVICANCNETFSKLPSQIKKTNNNFCSKSCAATFNNKNKTHGNRRSKLEKLIEDMLKTKYPYINFTCNQKNIIGSELDFYFPSLKLAIQINGPLHYQPIYGQDKLNQIKNMDEEKRLICNNLHIKLIEINCGNDKYLNKKLISQRFVEIENILAEEVGLDPNTRN